MKKEVDVPHIGLNSDYCNISVSIDFTGTFVGENVACEWEKGSSP